jgi:hypothetical protein
MIRENILVPASTLVAIFAGASEVLEASKDAADAIKKALSVMSEEDINKAKAFIGTLFNGFITDEELKTVVATFQNYVSKSALEQEKFLLNLKILREKLGLANDYTESK